jgi:multicomponent Na+:H+ antiporter subunit A
VIAALLALHAVIGTGIIALGERLGRRASYVALVAPVVTLVWLATKLPDVLDGTIVEETFTWVPQLGLDVDLRLDGFSALMVLIVSGIGVLVFVYALRYFPTRRDGLGRLLGLLVLFSGSMLGLVLADNLLLLYACWELTSITSYLLIGNDYGDSRARAAALQALLTTGAGGLAMLGGFIVVGQQAGTYRLSEVLAHPPSGPAVTGALVLVLLGAVTKSAQYPFHSWLPGAMVAPTPVSAYLHSATMVKAGVYLVARFTPAFEGVAFWQPAVVTIGLVTMVAGGLRALRQTDLKVLLAFGTISQLGFMFVLFGLGTPASISAGMALVLAHALFKATLFMDVGILDHQLGTREITKLPRLTRAWWPFGVTMVVAAASMAGIPLTFGFIDKEAAYEGVLGVDGTGADVVMVLVVAASVVTFAYSIRLLWGTFLVPARRGAREARSGTRPPVLFLAGPLLLTALTVLFGIVPGLLDGLVDQAAHAVDSFTEVVHLAFWHGFNTALGLSALTMALGALLFYAHRPLARVLAVGRVVPSGTDVYRRTLALMNAVADRVTGVVQSGSLPVYAGIILFTAAVVPGIALVTGAAWPGLPPLVDGSAQVVIAALILGAALGAAVVRRRFAAALLLGTVGYAMGALFVASGAPDLALTQTAIETLSTVLFVLVLRKLPDRFERRSAPIGRALRLVIALTVGVVVFVFALVAAGERITPPVSDQMVEMAEPEGHGKNVVNVILVDFRGFDTMGEITVLAAAAIGAVALARAGRRPGAAAAQPHPVTAPAGPESAPLEESTAP